MILFLFGAEFRASTRRLPAAARSRTVVLQVRAVGQEQRSNRPKEPPKTRHGMSVSNQTRLNFFAIGQKNEIFLFLVTQALTDFTPQKNPRFSHQTRKFVLYRGGPRQRPAGPVKLTNNR